MNERLDVAVRAYTVGLIFGVAVCMPLIIVLLIEYFNVP